MTSLDLKRVTRSFILSAAAVLISACAGTPTNSALPSIPLGESIHVVGAVTEIAIPNARTARENVASGAAGGAAGGAVMGAGAGVMAGFACGPLFVICSPVGLVGGAAGGAIFGAAVGGISNAMLALPKEKADALELIMAETIHDLSGSQTLVDQFKILSNDHWSVTDAGASTELTLGIEELSIDQGKNDMLVVKLINSIRVSYGTDERDTTRLILYTFVSEWHHIDHWIVDDGANFEAVIQKGLAANLADMIRELEGN